MKQREQSELQQSLADLEKFLETPVVPGELELWLTSVEEAANHANEKVLEEIHTIHPQEFQNMGQLDPEMLQRIEQLKETDEKNLEAWQAFQRELAAHKRKVNANENETPQTEDVSKLVDGGLEVILELRKQQEAIHTWMGEAANRDRGDAD